MNGIKQAAFLSEARKIPGVVKASGISHALFGSQKSGSNINWKDKDPEQEVWFEYGNVGYDMLELLEIELIEGRFFSKDFNIEHTKVVINQATKTLMGVENAVGKKFSVNDSEYEVIGVMKNFHFQSLHEQIKPTFFLLNNNNWYMKLAIRIQSDRMRETLSEIDEVYTKFNPAFPFNYSFHDQDQAAMYDNELTISLLAKYAAGLALLISSLGLFGLVSFVIERKYKEIGIRKVLGASSNVIIKMISKDFIVPICIASVLGIAFSTLIINRWLNEFAYRIGLEWWFFASAILLMVLIALLTSLSQILRAVTANPINVLKDE